MPSIDLSYGGQGPLIQVQIGVSLPHVQALNAANQPVPAIVVGTFLVDTGASHTAVDPGLVAPLGLSPTGSVAISTPSTGGGQHSCYQYDVMLHIPNTSQGRLGLFIEAMPVLEATLRPQGIDGLIGRDVLARCVMVTNGPLGLLTLSF